MIRLRAREAYPPAIERVKLRGETLGGKRPGERRPYGPGVLAVHNGLPIIQPAERVPGAPETLYPT